VETTQTPLSRTRVKAELRETVSLPDTRVRDGVFVVKLVVYAVLTATGAVLALTPAAWSRVLGTLLLGCMFAHAAELQHETLHSLAFRNRRANVIAGVVLGVPMLVSFAAYRAAHLRHHRDLGTPENREYFDYDASQERSSVWAWAVRLSMVNQWWRFLTSTGRTLRRGDFPGETATTSRHIRRDHLIMLAGLAGFTALSVLVGEALVVWLWLLPAVLVAAPVHALIELPEHFRCDTLNRDPFANTRTIRSNWFMTWFTNGNNFHVEHHLMPNLPIGRLFILHTQIRDRLQHFHAGYVRYFRSLGR
jgi:fatty acid desaturase